MFLTIIPTIDVKASITGNDTPITAYEITSLPFKADVELPQDTTAWFKIELDKDTSLSFKYDSHYRYYTIYSDYCQLIYILSASNGDISLNLFTISFKEFTIYSASSIVLISP